MDGDSDDSRFSRYFEDLSTQGIDTVDDLFSLEADDLEELDSLKGKKVKQKKFLEAIAKYKAAQQGAGVAAAGATARPQGLCGRPRRRRRRRCGPTWTWTCSRTASTCCAARQSTASTPSTPAPAAVLFGGG